MLFCLKSVYNVLYTCIHDFLVLFQRNVNLVEVINSNIVFVFLDNKKMRSQRSIQLSKYVILIWFDISSIQMYWICSGNSTRIAIENFKLEAQQTML